MKNKLLRKFILEFKSLKVFDIIWLVLCTIGITIISINTNNSLLAVIASIFGVIYVILNGCRLSVAFLFGIVNTFVYGIVSYQNGLYGDFMMNVFYSCPCCIVGLIAWLKASKETATARVSSFKLKEKIFFLLLIIFAIIVYGLILTSLNDTQPYLDATTTILSISAYICLIMRKKEVWYLFNFSNILSILMWAINYNNSNTNISILFMYIIYTANSLLNTIRWELSNRAPLEINILLYRGKIDLKWIKQILNNRDDIIINIYLYKRQLKVDDKRINIRIIPKNIKTFGGAYNYIVSKVHGKYFMLLDNLDYLDYSLFNKVITKDLLRRQYYMIKSNYFYIKENSKINKVYDDYKGSNQEIEDKIMNRGIFPYFFGSRIYQTKFIKKNKIKFNDTNIYNDVYPNILLARKLDMNKILILDSPFYIRYRLEWKSADYNDNDLRDMIQSLIKIDVPKEKILIRLVDSYNYSVNIRGCHNQYFIDTIKDFFDVVTFEKLVTERNKKSIYKKKEYSFI